MQKIHKIFVIAWLAAVPLCTAANSHYASVCLKRLAEAMMLCADTLPAGESLVTGYPKPVMVRKVDDRVTHIGYQLFPQEMKSTYLAPILDFLERYLLQISYPSGRTRSQMLRDDRFRFETGGYNNIRDISQEQSFSLTNSEGRYIAEWSDKGSTMLSVSFPATYELISGENKIEAESNFEWRLMNDRLLSDTSKPSSVEPANLNPTPQHSYYIKKAATYLSNRLSADLYYKGDSDGSFELLSDVLYPVESSANMMIDDKTAGNYSLNITQALYGYKKKKYTVSLRRWINYCKQEGCQLYFGVETVIADTVCACVVAANDAEGYSHLLSVKIPFQTIDDHHGAVDAHLETYIPTHHIANLFEAYHDKKRKQNLTE